MNSITLPLSKEELTRYDRHILLPDFGLEGQKKLKTSRVLVVGSGGLGSPVLLYLAAAGVGTLGIVDYDVVEDSNLQRQVLFGTDQLGQQKAEAAKQRLRNLNPYITINVYNVKLTSANALSVIRDYDLVADGSDNFPTRYLVNDACVLLDKPYVFASIFQFEGQVTIFNFCDRYGNRGPNYRDLFEFPPPNGLVPNCAEGGVLGVLPGIIGSLQALEVIKIVTEIGEILNGRLYCFDALTFESRILCLKRNPNNPLNGDNPTIKSLIDYEQFCEITQGKKIKEITAREFFDLRLSNSDFQLIDVREPEEYKAFHIDGLLIPLDTLGNYVDQISREKMVVIHCKTGGRSATAIRMLEDQFGFSNLYNMQGGIIAYTEEVKLILH